MTSESTRAEDPRWLLEPLAAGEARVKIEIAEGADLSPEVREAVEHLISALQAEDEVQGFMMGCGIDKSQCGQRRSLVGQPAPCPLDMTFRLPPNPPAG